MDYDGWKTVIMTVIAHATLPIFFPLSASERLSVCLSVCLPVSHENYLCKIENFTRLAADVATFAAKL